MLKAVIIDAIPYIINKSQRNQFIWRTILKDEEISFIENNPDFSFLLNNDLSISENRNEFIELMSETKERARDIADEFEKRKDELTKKFLNDFKPNQIWTNFFKDAQAQNCCILIYCNIKEWCANADQVKMPPNVTKILHSETFDINNIEEELSKFNISLNEFCYISDDNESLSKLVEKGCFCVKIDNSIVDKSIHYIDKIDDLDFGNLSYKFYDSDDIEQEDL